jgi:hypothetical protein
MRAGGSATDTATMAQTASDVVTFSARVSGSLTQIWRVQADGDFQLFTPLIGTSGTLTSLAVTDLDVSGTAQLDGRNLLTDESLGAVIELTSVAGTAGAYTAVTPYPITEMEDGNPRLFLFTPHVDGIPDPSNSNRITLEVTYDSTADATANIIRSVDNLNLLRGALKAGVRHLLLADGTSFYLLGHMQADALAPSSAELALWSETGNGAYETAKALLPLLPANTSSEFEQRNITGNNMPRHVGLLERNRPWVAAPASGATSYVDLTWMGNGQSVRIFVANSTGNATARLYQGNGVWSGFGSDKFISATNGAQILVTKYDVGGVETYTAHAEAGTAPVGSGGGASQTDVARARSVIMIGQSLALRCLQAGLPTEFDLGIEAISPAQTRSTRFVSVGAGSSSLFYATDNTVGKTNHWWDERTDIPGPLLDAAVITINNYLASRPVGEPVPAMMFFNIGQNDSDNIADTGTVTIRTMRANYRKVIEDIRTRCSLPSLITTIDLLGGDEFAFASDAQSSMTRVAQLLACKTDSGIDDALIRPGAEFYGLPRLPDDVHMSFEGVRAQALAYVDLYREYVLGQTGLGPVQYMGPRGITEVSQTEISSTVFQFRYRTSPGYGSSRNATYRPAGLELLPGGAAPSVNDEPIPIKSWRVVSSGVTNETIIEYTTFEPASGAKFVTNWGKHGLATWLGRLPRDSWSRRSFVTVDPRASLVTLP